MQNDDEVVKNPPDVKLTARTVIEAVRGAGFPGPSPRVLRGHVTVHYRLPGGCVSFSITWSMPKLAGFWRGGNSLKLESHWKT